jgi:hypothetical protein
VLGCEHNTALDGVFLLGSKHHVAVLKIADICFNEMLLMHSFSYHYHAQFMSHH